GRRARGVDAGTGGGQRVQGPGRRRRRRQLRSAPGGGVAGAARALAGTGPDPGPGVAVGGERRAGRRRRAVGPAPGAPRSDPRAGGGGRLDRLRTRRGERAARVPELVRRDGARPPAAPSRRAAGARTLPMVGARRPRRPTGTLGTISYCGAKLVSTITAKWGTERIVFP